MQLPWVEKYRPSTRKDLVGNDLAINRLYLFLDKFSSQSKFAGALLIGPAGCGKTSAVHAIANDLGFDVIEMNASDTRKKSSIKEIIEPASTYQSIDSTIKKRIILLDEVDGISGRYDRGGLKEIIKIIKSTSYPVICTANDPESDKLDHLKKILRVFEYERLDEFEIFELLHNIKEKENLDIDEIVLEEIASKAAGDIRAALNELESHSKGSNKVQLEERNKMKTLTEILNDLYRAKNFNEAREVFFNAPSDYRLLLYYLFDQTSSQCKTPEELANAYEQIAQADIVYNRIMKTQDWSLLRYFFTFIGPGIALSRQDGFYKTINDLPNIPSSFMSMGRAKRIQSKARKLAEKVAPKIHSSKNRFVYEEFDLFTKIMSGKKGAEIAAWIGLDDDEVEILQSINKSSSITEDIEAARRIVGKSVLDKSKKIEKREFVLDKFLLSKTEGHTSKEQQDEDIHEETGEEIDTSSDETEEEEEEEENDEGQASLDDFF